MSSVLKTHFMWHMAYATGVLSFYLFAYCMVGFIPFLLMKKISDPKNQDIIYKTAIGVSSSGGLSFPFKTVVPASVYYSQ